MEEEEKQFFIFPQGMERTYKDDDMDLYLLLHKSSFKMYNNAFSNPCFLMNFNKQLGWNGRIIYMTEEKKSAPYFAT